jgi:CHAT domain-containing protein/Tfp pilus assembly protein PilF
MVFRIVSFPSMFLAFCLFFACQNQAELPQKSAPETGAVAGDAAAADAPYKEGLEHAKARHYAEAESCYRRAAALATTGSSWAKARAEVARSVRQGDRETGKERARDTLLQDLAVCKTRFPSEVGKLHFHLGRTFYTLNDFANARFHYEKAIREHEQGRPVTVNAGQFLYLPYSEIFTRLGEYEKAIHIQQLALDTSVTQRDSTGTLLILSDIGITYSSMGKWDSAGHYFDRSVRLSAQYPVRSNEVGKRADHLGMTYSDWGYVALQEDRLDASQTLLDSALAHYPDNPETLQHLGEVSFLRGRFSRSDSLFASAEALYYDPSVRYNRNLAKVIRRRAQINLQRPSPDVQADALEACQRALGFVLPAFAPSSVMDSPDPADFYGENTILEVLELKSRVAWDVYARTKEPAMLQLADRSTELALVAHDSLMRSYGFESSKLFAQQQVRDLYERMTILLFEQKKMMPANAAIDRRILAFNEHSRAVLLREKRAKEDALLAAPIPQGLLHRGRDLRTALVQQRNLLAQLEAAGADTAPLRRKIFETEEALQAWSAGMEQDYPAWFRSQDDRQVDNISAIRDLVRAPGTLLVQHFYNAQSGRLYLSGLDADGLRCATVDVPAADIEFFVTMIRNRELGQNAEGDTSFQQDFVRQARRLYAALLAPVAGKELPKTLIIVADGIVGNVPFDVLLPRDPTPDEQGFRRMPYLLRSTATQYAPSAGLLVLANQKQGNASGYLGMAPAYSGYFTATQYGDTTTRQLAGDFGGCYANNAAADKHYFLKNAARWQVLHFYGHGKANGNKPELSYLAFSRPGASERGRTIGDALGVVDDLPAAEMGRVLFAHEIRAMQLQVDLVLLSACETGIGKDAGPEGALSLARAFWDAGSPATVMSLWKVNDEATASLSMAFMRYIKAGMPKNEALRQAKLDYMASSSSAIPYFWAGLSLSGSAKPLDIRPSERYLPMGDQSMPLRTVAGTVALLGLVLGVIILVFRQERHKA